MRSRRPDRGRVGRIRLGGGGARRRDGASWRRATAAGIRPRWWRAATGFTPACCSGGGVGIARRRTPTPDCSSWSSTHPSTSGATPVVWAAGAKMGDAGGEGREEGSRGRPARGGGCIMPSCWRSRRPSGTQSSWRCTASRIRSSIAVIATIVLPRPPLRTGFHAGGEWPTALTCRPGFGART